MTGLQNFAISPAKKHSEDISHFCFPFMRVKMHIKMSIKIQCPDISSSKVAVSTSSEIPSGRSITQRHAENNKTRHALEMFRKFLFMEMLLRRSRQRWPSEDSAIPAQKYIEYMCVCLLFMEVKHTYQNLKGLACIPDVVQLPFGRSWLLVRAVHRWSFHRWSFLSKKGAGPGTASSTCKVATTAQIFNPWIILAISGITMVASGQKSSAST